MQQGGDTTICLIFSAHGFDCAFKIPKKGDMTQIICIFKKSTPSKYKQIVITTKSYIHLLSLEMNTQNKLKVIKNMFLLTSKSASGTKIQSLDILKRGVNGLKAPKRKARGSNFGISLLMLHLEKLFFR